MKAIFGLVAVGLALATANNTERYAHYSNMVDEINTKQNLWKAELNTQILDGDYTTISNLLGDLSVGSKSTLPEKTEGWTVKSEDLPKNFIVQDNWPKCKGVMSTVHDQSACGSCWAVSTAAAAAERLCVKTGVDNMFLSSRDLLSCCSSCGFGCQGGWPSSAWDYIKNTGLVTGSPSSTNNTLCVKYPFLTCHHHTEGEPQCSDYDFDTPSCQKSCDVDSTWPVAYNQDKVKFSRSYSVSGEENIKKELFENGPMTFSYTVYEDFMNYKSGVYKHVSGKQLGGHATVLVGFGETDEGVKYWIVKNNWNSSWAEKGYFRIVRGDCSPSFTAGTP